MKKTVSLTLVLALCLVATPVFAVINWTNANANNDFDDLGNWNPVPPSLNNQDCYINTLSDADKAVISHTLSGNPDDLYVGVVDANMGELLISGGNNTMTNRFRVGRVHGTGIVTITGGTLNVPNTYTTFGDTGTAIFTMTGGTLNIDRVTFGQTAGDSSTMNMSAGTINISTSDATPATTSGSLRMGLGIADLTISGSAVITAEKLYIAEGGLITMRGGTVRITGAEDAQPTFNFTQAAMGDMAGEIMFNGGDFLVTGDYASLFNAAIDAGNIYTTVEAHAVYAEYFAEEGLTKLVLAPSEKAYHPHPADGRKDVPGNVILTWMAGDYADTHEVYLGTDANAVKNATIASPEYKGTKALGEESFDPGLLTLDTTYHWRIDEVNAINPDNPWTGDVWSFTTGDYFVIDDFEDYNADENPIWYSWLDGLGYGAPGTDSYYPGNGTGSAVGDETTASFTEETIVHGGHQSMPLVFDNHKQDSAKYSQVEFTLAVIRDWTAEGVTDLSLWFRGYPGSVGIESNDAEPFYVAVSNAAGQPAVVVHDDPAAAQIDIWTEWVIPLQSFADQGINLAEVDKIAIGLGTQGNTTVPGGSGKIFVDDIRLHQPRTAIEE